MAHRQKFQNVEIDFVFQKQKKLFLVEVKSLKDEEFFPYLLSKKQRKRLERALVYFHSIGQSCVSLHLATVNVEDEIAVFENILTFF